MTEHLVVVGAGQAATQVAQTLRQQNYAGAITLLGEEPYAPYQRPPLSKKYFSGETPRERLLLRPQAFYAEKSIALEVGTRVEEIDRAAHALRLHDGRTLRYDKLLFATGSRPRTLAVPGADLAGVHHVRTISDIDALNAGSQPGARVVVIGGGYIGLEMASVVRHRGFAVTVLEAADRVLGRVVCEEVSAFFTDLHRAAGVEVVLGAAVRALHGQRTRRRGRDGGRAALSVRRGDRRHRRRAERRARVGRRPRMRKRYRRRRARADFRSRRARMRRLHEFIRSSSTRVRCASSRCRTRSIRQRSRPRRCLGTRVAYAEIPWFWSDQYDVKMQIVGLLHGYDTAVRARRPRAEKLRGVLPREPAPDRGRRREQPARVRAREEADRRRVHDRRGSCSAIRARIR